MVIYVKDLVVWQKANQQFLDIAGDVDAFANKRTAWVIADQVLRSTGPISANIFEGFGRKTRADYEHFLVMARGKGPEARGERDIAKGSLAELRTQLQIAYEIGYIEEGIFNNLDQQYVMLGKMIGALIKARK